MKVNRKTLARAVEKGLLDESQSERFWAFLVEDAKDTPSFHFTHILYYLGGLIAIGAMTLFMNLGWERFGPWGLFFITMGYAGVGACATEFLLHRELRIPAGIAATFVVALVPLAIYALQATLGWWPDGFEYRDYHVLVDWRWLWMEFGTLAAGALMLWRYRFPFMVMPLAATLWYISMDMAAMIDGAGDPDWTFRKMVSLWIGLLILAVALRVDARTRSGRDYAFWLYLFGSLAFWGALTLMDSRGEWSKFLYLCINLLMIFVGAVLSRRVFAVFGGFGVAGYLSHLASVVFKDSLMFPFVLTLIGAGIVALGIVWQRREREIGDRMRALLPEPLRDLVKNRGGAE